MAMTSDKFSILCFFIVTSFLKTHAFSSGAPETACDSMMPGHGPPAQNTASPYTLTMNRACYERGRGLVFTLSSNDGSNIKGVLVQARQNTNEKYHGDFQTENNFPMFQTLNCPMGNGFTHKTWINSSSFKFVWIPDDSVTGNIIMTYTVVKELRVYWVKETMTIPNC